MIVFLVPVKHPANSNDYALTWHRLGNTIRSICRQTVDDYHVLVAVNEYGEPFDGIPEDKYTILKCGFHSIMSGHPQIVNAWEFTEHMVDKARKRMKCIQYARDNLCPTWYFMMDADDYVSDNLVESILTNGNNNICLVQDGIVFSSESWLYYKTNELYKICGSSVAVSPNWLYKRLDDYEWTTNCLGGHRSYFINHEDDCCCLTTENLAAYCQHTDNHGQNLWGFIRRTQNEGTLLTNELCERFGIYDYKPKNLDR